MRKIHFFTKTKVTALLLVLAIQSFFGCEKPIDTFIEEKEENHIYCNNFPKIENPNLAYFKGDLLGEKVSYMQSINGREGSGDWVLYGGAIGNFSTSEWKYKFVKFKAEMKQVITKKQDNRTIMDRYKEIILWTPAIPVGDSTSKYDYTNPEGFKNLFCLGKKKLKPDIAFIKNDSLSTFVLQYATFDYNIINPQINFIAYTATGNQDNSSLEITEVKEVPALLEHQKYRLQVKFKINCKLYDIFGNYKGNIKDGEILIIFSFDELPKK
ncbi:hypothetical protein [Thermoflexibacter ruber]|uniref:Uncharacterized protein n=1 Tax=Thermoflexibacter ruber TaxID=1003 RepID=A0A1I2JQJ4_9BACT|nr:hypothetical protein [Thermoflexibacter ruber]SFF56388.1 hypothetical protein SAMN04488541_10592 [Thermoflexibacter ruber]